MYSFQDEGWALLAESYRGQCGQKACVETSHLGAIAVVSGEGEPVTSVGDVERMVHLRSTAKPFQLLPFLLDNLDQKVFPGGERLDAADLALLMASHQGEERHTARIKRLLALSLLTKEHLLCGAHPPYDESTRRSLLQRQEKPSEIHNNCSGKHLAMLMVCQKNHWPLETYLEKNHPLQQRIVNLLLEVANTNFSQLGVGIDGCSLPTFILPLQTIAAAYAALSFPSLRRLQNKNIRDALQKLFICGVSYPEMIGGEKNFDTALMQALPKQLFVKSGADGILAMALAPCSKYPHGLGVAIKIADGDFSKKVRPAVALKLLQELDILPSDQLKFDEKLKPWTLAPIKSLRGLEAGFWRLD